MLNVIIQQLSTKKTKIKQNRVTVRMLNVITEENNVHIRMRNVITQENNVHMRMRNVITFSTQILGDIRITVCFMYLYSVF